MTSEINTCLICLEERKLVEFRPCMHFSLCLDCLLVLGRRLITSRIDDILCLVCREPCRCARVPEKDIAKDFLDVSDASEPLFQTLRRMARIASPNAVLPLALSIYRTLLEYERIRSGREDNLVFLSRDQIEVLLTDANRREGLESYGRALVAMCLNPWDVDANLSASGICYHGNFGIRPDNVCQRFLLLKKNYDALIDPDYTF
ncbi:MAG: RING finger protein [Sulfobacillus sp.]